MFTTNTTVMFNGTTTKPNELTSIMEMNARLEFDGSVNISRRFPSYDSYLENKEMCDKDYSDFETYVNGIVESIEAVK